MNTGTYQPSYGELAVLDEMFEKEVEVRGIEFPNDEVRNGAYLDFTLQYIENQDEDPHIDLREGVTAKKRVDEIDWEKVYC